MFDCLRVIRCDFTWGDWARCVSWALLWICFFNDLLRTKPTIEGPAYFRSYKMAPRGLDGRQFVPAFQVQYPMPDTQFFLWNHSLALSFAKTNYYKNASRNSLHHFTPKINQETITVAEKTGMPVGCQCLQSIDPGFLSWIHTIWFWLTSPWYRWPIEIDGLPIKNGDFPWLC